MKGKNVSNEDMVPKEAMEFAATLIQASSDSLQWTNTQLIEGYKHQAERAQAELTAIRESIGLLLSKPYMPSASVIEEAVYPSETLIKHYMKTAEV